MGPGQAGRQGRHAGELSTKRRAPGDPRPPPGALQGQRRAGTLGVLCWGQPRCGDWGTRRNLKRRGKTQRYPLQNAGNIAIYATNSKLSCRIGPQSLQHKYTENWTKKTIWETAENKTQTAINLRGDSGFGQENEQYWEALLLINTGTGDSYPANWGIQAISLHKMAPGLAHGHLNCFCNTRLSFKAFCLRKKSI